MYGWTPRSLNHTTRGARVFIKIRGADNKPTRDFKLVAHDQLAEPVELVVCCHDWYMELHILQIHTGHPLLWPHDCHDRPQILHLE